MYFNTSTRSRRPRKIEAMAGSERMLKAHHKNTVFHKSLEDRKSAFDATCHKKLCKVQQEIYHVYYNEYIPLKEEANLIRNQFPRIDDGQFNSKWTKLATIPGRGGGTNMRLPEIHALSLVSSGMKEPEKNKAQSTENVLDLFRQQEGGRNENKIKKNRLRREREMKTPCSLWPDDSESEDKLNIDEDRLRILKAAIALSSQPAKSPEPRRPRRLRKSFLVTLRRQSKIVWENELLGRVGTAVERDNSTDSITNESTNNSQQLPQTTNSTWLPSLSKNKILNNSDESEDDDMVFEFPDRKTSRTSMTSILSGVGVKRASIRSTRSEVPLHDVENDLYMSESSPDIYSVISEGTNSYSSGSSYSGDSESGSFYSSSDET